MKNQLVQYSREDFEKYIGEGSTPGIDQVPDWFKDAMKDAFWEIWKASRDALNGENHPTIPEDMTPEMMRAVQLNSELGAYAVSNLSGAYDMFAEFWKVAHRASMLQPQSDDDGEPTDDERIMAIEGILNCDRCGDEGWMVGEMGITRCACNQGNPVFKIDLNSDFIKHVKAVSEKVRAGNSPANPDCWCRTCRPVVLNDMRFVVCPDCGNKRCPRANDHRNSCTGSNEPGQEGSAYPDTPREVK